jgi:thiamine pyrophosphate-dependent acetolactate synthase large subunit-like protein
MAEINGGRLIARQLRASGVDRIFTVAAGPMVETLIGAVEEGLEVANCRHDMDAALAASAYGYVLRKPGVVVVGSGPGTTNAITPLYVATESAMPLVVLGGSMGTSHAGLGAFQELDQVRLAAPASKWAGRVQSINQIPDMLHLALGKSVSGRPGGVYLDFSGRLIGQTIDEANVVLRRNQPRVTNPQPDSAGVDRIAEMLATAERPLIVIGKALPAPMRVRRCSGWSTGEYRSLLRPWAAALCPTTTSCAWVRLAALP